jgi:hypothetical protein
LDEYYLTYFYIFNVLYNFICLIGFFFTIILYNFILFILRNIIFENIFKLQQMVYKQNYFFSILQKVAKYLLHMSQSLTFL